MNNYQRLSIYDTRLKSGMTLEDPKPYVICEDVYGEDIWSDSEGEYFDTEEGYLFIDDSIRGIKDSDLFQFLSEMYTVVEVSDIEDCEG